MAGMPTFASTKVATKPNMMDHEARTSCTCLVYLIMSSRASCASSRAKLKSVTASCTTTARPKRV
eukprot:2392070-Amphidinium_carterae.3